MIKSGGGKPEPSRQAGRSRGTGKNKQADSDTREITTLAEEAARLREELAIERKRSETLETTHASVAARLSKAIASIKQLLERQG
jgi:hypothetical protein